MTMGKNTQCTEAIFYNSKINSYGVYVVKKEKREEDSVHF